MVASDQVVTPGLDELLPEILACQICAAHLPLGPRPILQVHPSSIALKAT